MPSPHEPYAQDGLQQSLLSSSDDLKITEFERLRAQHVQLERQLRDLHRDRPRDIPAHDALLVRLAAHKRELRVWRNRFGASPRSRADDLVWIEDGASGTSLSQ